MIERFKNFFGLSRTFGAQRSSSWASVRNNYIKINPLCAICGRTGAILKANEVHHITPVHVNASLELLPENLITLCRDDHYTFAHLKNWKSWNNDIIKDASWFREKIKTRP